MSFRAADTNIRISYISAFAHVAWSELDRLGLRHAVICRRVHRPVERFIFIHGHCSKVVLMNRSTMQQKID
jgi:hypothetical protein